MRCAQLHEDSELSALQMRCAQLLDASELDALQHRCLKRRRVVQMLNAQLAALSFQMLNAQLAALSFGVYRAAFDIHLFAYAVRATVHRAADAAHAAGLLP